MSLEEIEKKYSHLALQFKSYKFKVEQLEDLAKASQHQAQTEQKRATDLDTVLGRVKLILVEDLTNKEKIDKLQKLLNLEPVQDPGLVDRMIESGQM